MFHTDATSRAWNAPATYSSSSSSSPDDCAQGIDPFQHIPESQWPQAIVYFSVNITAPSRIVATDCDEIHLRSRIVCDTIRQPKNVKNWIAQLNLLQYHTWPNIKICRKSKTQKPIRIEYRPIQFREKEVLGQLADRLFCRIDNIICNIQVYIHFILSFTIEAWKEFY